MSERTRLDEQEQEKLTDSATIPHDQQPELDREKKTAAAAAAAAGRPGEVDDVPPRSAKKLSVSELEREEITAAGSLGEGPIVKRHSPRKISVAELEREKEIAAGSTTGLQQASRRSPSIGHSLQKRHSLDTLEHGKSRTISVAELEREKGIAAGGTTGLQQASRRPPSTGNSLPKRLSLDELEYRKMRTISVSEMEREKSIAAAGISGLQQASRRPPSAGLSLPRRRSLDELELGGNITAAGMGGSLHEDFTSAATTMSHQGVAAKDRKVLTDQSGRSIDIDLEFARLHSVSAVGSQHASQLEDAGVSFVPGAFAVCAAEYEVNEDLEPDYVNPDNFDALERANSARATDTTEPMARTPSVQSLTRTPSVQNLTRTPSVQHLRAQEELSSLERSGQDVLFPGVRKKRTCVPIVVLLVIIVSVAVGVTLGTRGSGCGSGDDCENNPSSTTMRPTAVPTSPPSTTLPTLSAPSLSAQPSLSSAPTMTPWTTQGQIQGESFGSSVQIATDLIAFSNSSSIRTYEFSGTAWTPIGQPLDGDVVRLSESKRIAVRSGGVVKVYDLVGGTWTQIGSDIPRPMSSKAMSIASKAISISGDGSTVAITEVWSDSEDSSDATIQRRKHESYIYRFDENDWSQLGKQIAYNDFFEPFVGNALTFDGNKIVLGFRHQVEERGYSLIFGAPTSGVAWKSINPDAQFFRGGPSMALSNDGAVLVTGDLSGNILAVHTAALEKIPSEGLLRLEGDADTTLSMTLTDNGKILAYAWQNSLQIRELVGDRWAAKGTLPTIDFDIDSVSFSSDGRLAVGQPGGNLVEIFEIYD